MASRKHLKLIAAHWSQPNNERLAENKRRAQNLQHHGLRTTTQRQASERRFHMRPVTQFKRSRGVALVAVIWVTGILALIATSLVTTSRTETNLSRNRVSNTQARALADAGVQRAIYSMLLSYGKNRGAAAGTSVSAEYDARSFNSRPENLDDQSIMRGDGSKHTWVFDGKTVFISVQLESGKINLNGGDEEVLRALFASVGLSPSEINRLTDSLLDFLDPDSERRPSGRETPGYAELGLKYGAKNRNFEALDELLLIPGVTRKIYRKIRPALTVYSANPGFNPSYAPIQVFMTLPGIDKARATEIVARRRTMTEESFRASLPESPYFSRNVAPVMTITAEALTSDGATFTREAVVALTPNENPAFHIFTWR